MRIGIDVRLQNESGVGRYIRNLGRCLKQIDKQNKYVLLDAKVKWHSLREQIVMPFVLLRENLDLVHFPYFNVPVLYPAKFVVTIHDLTISHFGTGKASTLNPWLYRIKKLGYRFIMWNAIKRAKKVIVPTNAVKNDILRRYKVDTEKIVVIYEGAEMKWENRIPKSKIVKNLTPEKYFLYVGNAYPHKNLELLILSFRQILAKKKPWSNLSKNSLKLVLVGKKDYFYKKLENKVKKIGFENEIIFTGYVEDDDLVWLYRNAIALVLPSLMEGFGLPALEAMRNGCLVLASDVPALHEVCAGAAVYFDPESKKEIADRMREVVEKPGRYKVKLETGRKIARKFSWAKMAKKVLEVYLSVSA